MMRASKYKATFIINFFSDNEAITMVRAVANGGRELKALKPEMMTFHHVFIGEI